MISNHKEALAAAFPNYPAFLIRIDRRRKVVKEILKFFSEKELYQIANKRVLRTHAEPDTRTTHQKLVDLIKRLRAVKGTPYEKRILEGNNHLYICSTEYGHSDYNKSVFGANTPSQRRLAKVINHMVFESNI